jgi:hypothetical protein
MLRYCILAFVIVICPLTTSAQYFDADVNLLIGVPQGDFRDNLDRTAFGINGSIAGGSQDSPFQFGLELGIMSYGSDRRRENFNPNIPEVQVVVRTDYDILTGHFFGRLERPHGLVRPYADALVGLNYLFTESRITDDDEFGEDIASTTNFDDTTFSYGLGGGLKVKVYQQGSNKYMVNLKTRYLFGGEASYLQPGSIQVVSGNLRFDESTSDTHLLTIHLGMSFKF